jgi:Ti-type conjugative transfer relaxase TraA
MMSIAPRAAGAATSYYLHLQEDNHRGGSREDYYTKEGEGHWFGTAAGALGLEGRVQEKDFSNLARGYAPDGVSLVQNAGDLDRRAGWDLTFSAPKSVSVAWGLGDDVMRQKIEAAHQQAVSKALDFIQDRAAFSRRGQGGAVQEKASLIGARFDHFTSRELDPQLHSHCFIFNSAQRSDGSWGTLESHHFYDWQKAAGALYRVEFAEQMRQLGFTVERDGQSFRVAEVPHGVEREFSQRREQIKAAMTERGVSGAKAAEAACLDSRKSKEVRDPDELRHEWAERARSLEFQIAPLHERAAEPLSAPSAADVLNAATEHRAVLREVDVYTAAFQAAQGVHSADAALKYVDAVKSEAVTLGGSKGVRYSTVELVKIEREILDLAKARTGEARYRLDRTTVEKAIADFEQRRVFKLSAEQRRAVEHLTAESGGVKVLVGDAGTGKSTALEAVKNAYESEGFKVLGCAPSGKAAAELQAGTGIDSRTVHRLINDVARGREKIDSKTVIVLDEAAMVDSRLMHRLSTAVHAAGGKLIEVGDHKQIQPVGPGSHFRHQAEHLGHARLEEIRRQRDEWRRESVKQMSQGDAAKAMQTYIDRGLVDIKATHKQAVAACSKEYFEARAQHGEKGVAMMATTNKVVNDLNAAARAELKRAGELQNSRDYNLNGHKIEITSGDRVLLTKNDYKLDVRNGDLATVTHADKNGITVKLDRENREVRLDLREYQDVKHGYAFTVHKAQGSTVEKAIVFGSSNNMSRETAYVADSRAREETKWVFTSHQVNKLAEQSGVERAAGNQLDKLQESLKAMSQSKQSESTLDYKVKTPDPEPEKER